MSFNATYKRYIGIARELGSTTGVGTITAGASVVVTLDDPTGFTSSSKVTIYDGANTEVCTASALSGSNITLTTVTNSHPNGCLITTVGTVSAGPTAFAPVTKFDPKDDYTRLRDTGWRGSDVELYGLIDGVRHSEISVSSDAFPDTIGYFASSLLGDVQFTAGVPNQHKLAVQNSGNGQGSFYQLTDVYLPGASGGALTRQYGGVQGSDFSLKFTADGMLQFDWSGTAYASGLVAKPNSNFSSEVPLAAWIGVPTVGGVIIPKFTDGSLDIKRNVEAIAVLGQQDPAKVFGGPNTLTGKFTVAASDETFLNAYRNNTQPSLDLTFSQGSGASQRAIEVHCSQIGYTSAAPASDKVYITYPVEFEAIGNTSDQGASAGFSTCYVLLKNALPTGTYG